MNGKERISKMSKKWLIKSLFQLMNEGNYDDITVTNISDNADLARRTFYRYFKNKNDLLDYYYNETINEYFAELNNLITSNKKISFDMVLQTFFEFFWNKRDETRTLIKQGLFFNLFLKSSSNLKSVYKNVAMPWHINNDDEKIQYVLNFFIGGYMNIISRWLMKEEPESSKAISKIVYDAIKKM
ncbi:TetR/AcrR family transcriptional regulator [Apilactobacillus timberlakei]|uniref:TetR/AcrR family transcriptional regulator n=1 Tax=Apilactobacillus timberlakei TaxID=2008380 RepID=A0ABY2YTZ5_9LACO|nr:TetR/AcrR family transcriptional regulator [Apilactobacillus timberlakei]TPR13161.1 TetR/AcrR family transcriptional regulator [Apilactobacillus timberlakei]TPR14211.1 TetR/AcrR family transcriptional regulator [Apilactobacillus timberlakei]TPR16464.1 TetR/AcrR family transcriptional regulator [Apilactobacillus timberlakei]